MNPQTPLQTPPKSRLTAPVWLIAGVAVVFALCCLGGGVAAIFILAGDDPTVTAVDRQPPGATPTQKRTPDGPTSMKVGDTGTYAEADNEVGELTLLSAERFDSPRTEYGDPPDNDGFLLVTIEVVATGEDLYSVNPYDFYTRDGDGRRYEFAGGTSLWAVDDTLNHTELNPGERVTADLVFDVPDGGLELVYAPGSSRSLAFWKIP